MSHEYLTWSSMCQAVTVLMTLLSFFFTTTMCVHIDIHIHVHLASGFKTTANSQR